MAHIPHLMFLCRVNRSGGRISTAKRQTFSMRHVVGGKISVLILRTPAKHVMIQMVMVQLGTRIANHL